MKILLIDDQSNKLRELYRSIKKIEGINTDSIEHVLDLNEARKKLRETLYDLVVLDLKIPDSIGEVSDELAGKDFIDEIVGIDSYFKPNDIIILTEYEELKEKFIKNNNYCFSVLKYDSSITEWATIICGKIKYIMAKEKSFIQQERIHVGIITAVPVETEAIKRLSSNWTQIKVEQDPTIYYKTKFNDITILHAQQSEMGMSASATLTAKIINNFNPKYIIMIGIAAGIGKDKNAGDILIPTEVWNYCSGKYVKCNGDLYSFEPNPGTIPLNPYINELLNQDFSEVLFKIKKKYLQKYENDLKIIRGPIACGSAVVANEEIVNEFIKRHQRKTIGLDMESYGMFYAAQYTDSLCHPICIKSICDFADDNKNDEHQEYASYTSATFAKFIIENILSF